MVKRYQLVDGKLVENGRDNCAVQVYINPDENEKKYLTTVLLLDEHTLNSTFDPDELSRLEFEANHVAMIVKRPKRYTAEDNFLFKVSSSGLFLFSDKLIIVVNEDENLFDNRLFQRLNSLTDILLRVVFRSIQHFESHLNVIHKASNELEALINKSLTNKDLLYMFSLEKSLVYYLKAINSNSKLVDKIKTNSSKLGLSQENNEFLEDVIIETTQCLEEANTYLQVISGLMDAWASIVSNNLNIRMKTLTILSICIMLPTLIVSIFSMNVPLPLPHFGGHIEFWVVASLAALSAIIILLVGRYRKW